jgi:hypothetical protein
VRGEAYSRLSSTAFRTAQAETYWADRTGNFAPRSPVTRSRTTVNIREAGSYPRDQMGSWTSCRNAKMAAALAARAMASV